LHKAKEYCIITFKMKRRQTGLFAYLLAILALLVSLCFWRQVVNMGFRAELLKVEGEGPPALLDQSPQPGVAEVDEKGLREWGLHAQYQLFIPSLRIRAPVLLPSLRYWDAHDWKLLERQMQIGLLHGVVAYPHSVAPGDVGSLIVAGHSSPPDAEAARSAFGDIFARLPDLTLHDQIVLMNGSSTVTYEVVDTKVVTPRDTSILLQQEEESLLVLITCYPIGTVKDRLVLIAKNVSG
jgi:LPXTG-site transpeptidase (sortase) family protein